MGQNVSPSRREVLLLGAASGLGIKQLVVQPVTTSFSGSFRVRDFGARGDGSADDTASIQAALDQAGLRGGEVLLDPGTYCISSPLYLRLTAQSLPPETMENWCPVALRGLGRVEIRATQIMETMVFIGPSTWRYSPHVCRIENLAMNGGTQGQVLARRAIHNIWSSNTTVQNCRLFHVDYGYVTEGYGVSKISRNTLRTHLVGIYFRRGGDSSIVQNDFYLMKRSPYASCAVYLGAWASNMTITRNIVTVEQHQVHGDNLDTVGIKLSGADRYEGDEYGGIRDVVVRDNEFMGTHYGVLGTSDLHSHLQHILIEGNHFAGGWASRSSLGYFERARHLVIRGNNIGDESGYPMNLSQLTLNDCHDVVLAENLFAKGMESAVQSTGSRRLQVHGNRFANPVTAAGRALLQFYAVSDSVVANNCAWSDSRALTDSDFLYQDGVCSRNRIRENFLS